MASLVAISIMVMMTIFKSGKTIDYYDESAKQTAHESLDKHVTMYLIYTHYEICYIHQSVIYYIHLPSLRFNHGF